MWGTIATGLFDNQNGLFYDVPNKEAFFGYQIVGMLAIMLWTAVLSSSFFLIMKKLGKFRIDLTIEIIGLDVAEMGGLTAELFDKIIKDT